MMVLPNKIVRRTLTNGQPIKIGVHLKDEEVTNKDDENIDGVDPKEELRAQEERLNQMLADIEQREKDLAEKFISIRKDEKKVEDLKQRTQAECDRILQEAEAEADDIFNDAKKDGYAKGFEEGYEFGHDNGEKNARDELKETIRAANKKAEKTIQDAKDATAEYFIRAENDIAEIVMMAIEKILPQHFIDVPKDILPVVREAIKYVRDQKEVKIHVEPDSYDMILTARGDLQQILTDGTAILEIVPDDALKPGDCVVETPNGGVDARLSTQMELVKDAVRSMMN